MDRKKLQARLADWSREFGFMLPDGTFPDTNFFSPLVATPNRCHLWETILNTVQPRDKVIECRKQILAAKCSGLNKEELQGALLINKRDMQKHDILSKIDMWKKKEILEKKLKEKRKMIEEAQQKIYKKAARIQSLICEQAKYEKEKTDLDDKNMLVQLALQKYNDNILEYKSIIEKLKKFGVLRESNEIDFDDDKFMAFVKSKQNAVVESFQKSELEADDVIYDIVKDMENLQSAQKAWTSVMVDKKNNLESLSSQMGDCSVNGKSNSRCNEESKDDPLRQLKEQFMLDITENSLEAISWKVSEELEDMKFKEVIREIEKYMFNSSITHLPNGDVSYLASNETGDSITGRSENMAKLMKAIEYFGLKKRMEFLRSEIGKIKESNEQNERWLGERKRLEETVNERMRELELLKKELKDSVSLQKKTALSVVKKQVELKVLVNRNSKEVTENHISRIVELMREMEKLKISEVESLINIPMDAFRRVRISPDKQVFEPESLLHCLDHYGGEHSELFSSILLSPFDGAESVLAKLSQRKELINHVTDLRQTCHEDMETRRKAFEELIKTESASRVYEKNYNEAGKNLRKMLLRKEHLESEKALVKRILKNWLVQPYRLMIPETVTLNGMSYRQYEKKVQSDEDGKRVKKPT